FATWAATSSTTASFACRLRATVYLQKRACAHPGATSPPGFRRPRKRSWSISMIATQTLASGPPSAQGLPVYGRDGLKIWPAWPDPPDGWNLPDRSTTPRAVDLPTVFDNPPRTTIRPRPGRGPRRPKVLCAGGDAGGVDLDTDPHRRGNRHLAQVDTFRARRPGAIERLDQRPHVRLQRRVLERGASDRGVDDSRLVGTVLHLARLGVLDRGDDVRRHCADL